MTHSLNEVSAQAKKAARGAGYDWGMADEAARATRWLCAQGLDGCAALAACLDAGGQSGLARVCEIGADQWQSADQRALCPLHIGAALSDRAATLGTTSGSLTIRQAAVPLLLVPFLSQLSRQIDTPLHMRVGFQDIVVDGVFVSGAVETRTDPADVTIFRSETEPDAAPKITRAAPQAEAWDRLGALAHLTYAPATDASRAKGAGGDLPDTD